MQAVAEARLDKWLWAARVFKTRSQAAAACHAGHVKLGDRVLKPSHGVRPGEVYSIQSATITRTFRVLGLLPHRVGGALAKLYAEDLTPPEEYRKRRDPAAQPPIVWPEGMGRPTKRNQRQLKRLSHLLAGH